MQKYENSHINIFFKEKQDEKDFYNIVEICKKYINVQEFASSKLNLYQRLFISNVSYYSKEYLFLSYNKILKMLNINITKEYFSFLISNLIINPNSGKIKMTDYHKNNIIDINKKIKNEINNYFKLK